MIRKAALLTLVALALAACQSVPPTQDAKAVTYGDWTVKTSGYVRAEGGVAQ